MFLWQGWWPASDDETIEASGPNTRAEKHRFDVNRKLAMQSVKGYAEGIILIKKPCQNLLDISMRVCGCEI